MDKTKSITIIAVTVIVVAGIVTTSAIYFSNKKQSAGTGSQPSSINGNNSNISTKGTPSVSKTPGVVLSLSESTSTKLLLSATCEVAQGLSCELWGNTKTDVPEFIAKSTEATARNITETSTIQYTWDLEKKGFDSKYISFFGKAYDSSDEHIADSTPTQL